jgi:hypothetical protein
VSREVSLVPIFFEGTSSVLDAAPGFTWAPNVKNSVLFRGQFVVVHEEFFQFVDEGFT